MTNPFLKIVYDVLSAGHVKDIHFKLDGKELRISAMDGDRVVVKSVPRSVLDHYPNFEELALLDMADAMRPADPKPATRELAHRLYDRYTAHAGGVSWTGITAPPWESLVPEVRNHWRAVAEETGTLKASEYPEYEEEPTS